MKNKEIILPELSFRNTADLSYYGVIYDKGEEILYRVSFSGQYSDDILYSSEKLGIG